ncbi:hypothetical protein PGT21_010927 [Puccinia graminis f. sp. tritici]|uniref:Uncharacterized protein n=2 Tax=Puccinia graminis f. sp. tritici TaxID=56615 RepID=A0A5B0RVG3_PUCGR|nr:hypothetical protein PGT21_010927 [Puccinia graminis f. sp. tritici]KAA1129780.1 hypothetical protein PGTUg99_002111 [Puccinia graminis f. sp. tritici]
MFRFLFCCYFLLLISFSPICSTTLASEGYAEESPTWKIGDDIWKGIEPFKFDSVTTCLSKPWDTESGFHHDLLQFNDPFHVVQEQHDQTCGDMVHFNQPEKIEMKSLPLLASSSDKVVNHSPEHTQYNGQTPGSNRFIEQFTSAPAATNEYQNCELTSCDGQDNELLKADKESHNIMDQLKVYNSKVSPKKNKLYDGIFQNHRKFRMKDIQPGFLHIFIQRFSIQFGNLEEEMKKCRFIKDIPFGKLPIVASSRFIRPIEQSTHKYIQNKDLTKRIKRLVSWLIYINTATLRKFLPKFNRENEMESHNKLIDWLIQETFDPESGVPVMGMIKADNFVQDERAFQKHQIDLIQYLSSCVFNPLAIGTACRLVLVWYNDSHPNIASLLKGSEQSKIDFLVDVVLTNAIRHKIGFIKEVGTLCQCGAQFRELNMIGLEEFPKTLIPQRNFPNIGLLGVKETNILKKIESKCRITCPTNKARQKFEDIPIYLLCIESVQLLRISNKFHENISTNTILDKCRGLLNYLMLFHQVVLSHILKGKWPIQSQDTKDFHSHFLDWLSNELLQPNRSLPVFGEVVNKNQPLTRSRFGEVQQLLINYFSENRAHKMLPEVSNALLEYWYRKQNFIQWSHLFQDENPFDKKILLDILKKEEDCFEGFKYKRRRNTINMEIKHKKIKQESW